MALALIDAHHHFQDLRNHRYPWLDADAPEKLEGDLGPIRRDYLATDYARDVAGIELVAVGARAERLGPDRPHRRDPLARGAGGGDRSSRRDRRLRRPRFARRRGPAGGPCRTSARPRDPADPELAHRSAVSRRSEAGPDARSRLARGLRAPRPAPAELRPAGLLAADGHGACACRVVPGDADRARTTSGCRSTAASKAWPRGRRRCGDLRRRRTSW